MGIVQGHRGYTSTLYEKVAMGFLMTTESQDLGLTFSSEGRRSEEVEI